MKITNFVWNYHALNKETAERIKTAIYGYFIGTGWYCFGSISDDTEVLFCYESMLDKCDKLDKIADYIEFEQQGG